MKLIAVNILVLVLVPLCVHSNSNCTHSKIVKQRFAEMKNQELKTFFNRSLHGINDADCVLSYNVTFGHNKFYPYHFQLREGTLHIYGMLNVHATTVQHIDDKTKKLNSKTEYTYFWNRVSSKLFDQYYYKCSGVKRSYNKSLPEYLLC